MFDLTARRSIRTIAERHVSRDESAPCRQSRPNQLGKIDEDEDEEQESSRERESVKVASYPARIRQCVCGAGHGMCRRGSRATQEEAGHCLSELVLLLSHASFPFMCSPRFSADASREMQRAGEREWVRPVDGCSLVVTYIRDTSTRRKCRDQNSSGNEMTKSHKMGAEYHECCLSIR